MDGDLTGDPDRLLRVAKDRIAMTLDGGGAEVEPRVGSLRLRQHQLLAVGRLLEIMTRYRGALLADAVGLGKTYVALAVAREHARPVVISPAALRPMWERAMTTANLPMPIISIEALARGERPAFSPDLLIVDEAHHIRTPATRRYEAVASLARRARVLLMSATPIHNSRRDLDALLGIFAGSGVARWSDAMLARLIVRRDAGSARQELPVVDGPHALCPAADDDCLDDILALPPAIPAADEGVAHALATMSLVHLWSSSRGALLASVRKRRARAIALRDAVESGHLPTAGELSAWTYAEDALQLAFPFCVTNTDVADASALGRHLDAYIHAAGRLIQRCRETRNPDLARAGLLRTLRAWHAGERIVAFSQYAHTVSTLGSLMREEPGISVVTADGGRIAGGRITREAILSQFAGDGAPVRDSERIDLLLATDLLSEGIDLRGASVIIHLDLPWNPARLEQRVGRARRIGSHHPAIRVYTFIPPAAAERMLELQRRLSAKVSAANSVVGGMDDPVAGGAKPRSSPVDAGERLRAHVASWRDPGGRDDDGRVAIAAAGAAHRGWIAAVILDGLPRLVYSLEGAMGEDPAVCAELLQGLGDAISVDADRAARALRELDGWLAARMATSDFADESAPRRAVLERLTQTVARSARHRRPAMLASAQRARGGLARLRGVGTERVLSTLARSAAEDEAWMHSLETFVITNELAPDPDAGGARRVVALILLA
ncbi:MAG TPA: helicase-related protein [Gemmatimonadaceae bacterium]|nr:helicase-related protein [Gemmatimonadaceae bacterium]